MWNCVKEAFKANLPHNLDFWLLGILIGCVVAGMVGMLGGRGLTLPSMLSNGSLRIQQMVAHI